jgi:hypothetical protein
MGNSLRLRGELAADEWALDETCVGQQALLHRGSF